LYYPELDILSALKGRVSSLLAYTGRTAS
jgi:hypothetical protein